MNYKKIEYEIKKQGKTITELAKYMNLTYRGLRRKLNIKNFSVEELKKISEYLNVPITYWFNDEQRGIPIASNNILNGDNNKTEIKLNADIEKLQNQIDMLKIELRLKNELIESLREQIKILISLINKK